MTLTWDALGVIVAIIAGSSAGFVFLVNLMVRITIQEHFAKLKEWSAEQFATAREISDLRRSYDELRDIVDDIHSELSAR